MHHAADNAQPPPSRVAPRRRQTHPLAWVGAGLIVAALSWQLWQQNHLPARLPLMPVNVNFRRSLLGEGGGYVLMLANTSDRPLPLMASLTHPAINDTRKFDLYIAPRSHTEVGKLNGWIAQSGDQITLENSNFQTWAGSIP